MIEKIILTHLAMNETFARITLPYLIKEYFTERNNQVVFELTRDYINKYNNLPSKEALLIDLLDVKINDEEKEKCEHLIWSLEVDPKTDIKWVTDETEQFCQDRAVYLALNKCLEIS